MKIICTLLGSLLIISACSKSPSSGGSVGPSILWSAQDGAATATVIANSIAVDASGNTYVVGNTNKAIDGQILLGTQDFYISKYNSSGVLQWTVEDGSATNSVAGNGIAVDSVGNVFVTGQTNKAIDGQTLQGLSDFFISRYNTNGVRQWTVEYGVGGANTGASAITLDSSDNVYIVGSTHGAVFGLTYLGTQDLFLAKYTSAGVFVSAAEDGATSVIDVGTSIAVDSSQNMYVTGYTNKPMDGQTLHGTMDFFLSKYNANGTFGWTVEDGTSGATVLAQGVTVDSSGNAYVAGTIFGAALDGQTQHSSLDLFITKYNTSGIRQWTTEDGSSGASLTAAGIAIDISGNLYFCGHTNVAIDGQSMNGFQDAYYSEYNSSGTLIQTVQAGTTGATASASGIAVDASGNVYLAGNTNLGMNGHTEHGIQDLLIVKY